MNKPVGIREFQVKVRVALVVEVEVQVSAGDSFDVARDSALAIAKSVGVGSDSPNVKMTSAPVCTATAITASWQWNV